MKILSFSEQLHMHADDIRLRETTHTFNMTSMRFTTEAPCFSKMPFYGIKRDIT